MDNVAQEQEREIDQMQITIQQAQHSVRMGQALERLQQNPDFQALVMQDYFKDQATRLTHLLSDPEFHDKKKRKTLLIEMEAIGTFMSFLRVTDQRAAMAREAIRVNSEELANIEAERAQ